MTWVTLLKVVLGFAKSLADYLHDNRLIDAGKAKAISDQLENSINVLQKARKARDDAESNFDKRNGLPDNKDPNLRD